MFAPAAQHGPFLRLIAEAVEDPLGSFPRADARLLREHVLMTESLPGHPLSSFGRSTAAADFRQQRVISSCSRRRDAQTSKRGSLSVCRQRAACAQLAGKLFRVKGGWRRAAPGRKQRD